MRRLLLTAALAILPVAAQAQSSFDRGFEQGYQAINPNSITPIAPIGPIPRLGQTEFQSGIEQGTQRALEDTGQDYRSGYDAGRQDQEDDDQ